MASLASVFKASRSSLTELETDRLSAEFYQRFGLSEGDYLEVQQANGCWRAHRIVGVRQCFFNAREGYTAEVLTFAGFSGRTGNRLLTLVTSKGGKWPLHCTGLHGPHAVQVKRPPERQ